MTIPWLTLAIALPALGSLIVALIPRERVELAKRVTLACTLVVLAIVGAMALNFDPSGDRLQFTEVHPWIARFGVHYAVGVDGIALTLIVLSALLVPLVVLAAWKEQEEAADRGKGYFALILLLEAMMIGVFAAIDVFLFYVLFEAMLIPVYFMIGRYGRGEDRRYAAMKFLLYSLAGGLLMLVSVIGVYAYSAQAGNGTFLWSELAGPEGLLAGVDTGAARWLFLGFFVAFAIKAPMWPVHTWLPTAAGSARPGTAVLLVGVLDKVGTYGMLRYCLELFPGAAKWFVWPVVVLSLVSIIYGAIVAIGQSDMLRLIAYTSVSHFGFITLGIFAMTSQGQSGAALYMVNHGFSTGALFLLAGFLIARNNGSAQIADYGGLQKAAPVLAGTFLVVGLSSLALPGLSPFVSEFLVFVGTFTVLPVPAIIATIGVVLAALYILWLYQRTMTGPLREKLAGVKDLSGRELWAVAPLVAVIILFGVFPQPLLNVINPAVEHTMQQVDVSDPAPAVGVDQASGQEGADE
ncbi:NADH-quinone oxidoreductase subunit M [Thermobifida fusca]|jgi:NADH-quinone oxidoreductase subunit M|uniref:NADH dehydrogenase subunit M n=2 Tax=Thermobifida fusca TaxID=2021 RepID=A0A9P2T8C3_THEFU|nr:MULTISPECIES: NADH-quinone oxidoreductase subunit M [Thermobifida]AAZ56716.1 proton-translocating NADH-quinone oxidoreductase, chain M [Thermobifida fusca YX]EOR70148.1 NADH dehydrogenase subunit M [Thermobifida fusca TM51]MBO2528969.1 NADH-quinone oxidoreductase subunit M [Thermobifida sp.]PPS95302.1 NADH-quinone oxidoreductase subunit M [Thermobifida fusca]PZN66955.1 MAG: NADH-quinone oxidoreductase subunit M [Thermobifida fusca]